MINACLVETNLAAIRARSRDEPRAQVVTSGDQKSTLWVVFAWAIECIECRYLRCTFKSFEIDFTILKAIWLQLLFWSFPDNVCVCDIPTSLPARPSYLVRTCPTPMIWNTPTSPKVLSDFDSKVLFLDLDQVIVGPLDALVAYQGPLALLHTDTIACELASGGYNSSVISWWLGIGQWLADIDPWCDGNLQALAPP